MIRGLICASGFIFFAIPAQGMPSGAAYAPAPPGKRPSCASESATFCEQVKKYPAELIHKLLRTSSKSYTSYFTDESEGLNEPPDYMLHQYMLTESESKNTSKLAREKRFVRFEECNEETKVVIPEAAANGEGSWKIIAQSKEMGFEQKKTVRLCRKNTRCSKCVQMYNSVSMVSVGSDEALESDTFWMPSSCLCLDEVENAY